MIDALNGNLGKAINILSIFGLACQFMPEIPIQAKYAIMVLIAVYFLVLIIISAKNREIVQKKTMIKYGQALIDSALDNVILFGGDMSWTEYYYKNIKTIVSNGKTVIVYFPKEKLTAAAKENAERLRTAGATIKSINKDYGLRCIIKDSHFSDSHEDMEIFIAKRISRDSAHKKYRVKKMAYSRGKDIEICKSFLTNCKLIGQSATDY